MPKITIIVPVYKVEKYLRRCLDSIVNQTFTDWECILIDDGSPDDSGKICDDYFQKDTRFRVFHQENQGVSAARNKGLNEARGEWIGFVDSDDWIEKDMYEIAYKKVVEENADLVQWNYIIEKKNLSIKTTKPDKIFSLEDANIYWFSSNCNKLIRSKIVMENDIRFPVGIKIGEDKVFGFLAYVMSKKCVHLSKHLYHYVMIESSASHSLTIEKILQEETALKTVEERIRNMSITIDEDFLLFQKCSVKIHALNNLPSPNIDLCRSVFPEINRCFINKRMLLFSFTYFWAHIHFDVIVHLIVWLRRKLDGIITKYRTI